MTSEKPEVAGGEDSTALVARLRAIEEQPLETRAEALAHIHEELRTVLEAGDAAAPRA